MKISGRKQVSGTTPVGQASRAKEKPKVEGVPTAETRAADVNLSEAMSEVARARESAKALPDILVEAVEELKPIVNDGSYRRESKVIAKKMVDSSLRESAHLLRSRKK